VLGGGGWVVVLGGGVLVVGGWWCEAVVGGGGGGGGVCRFNCRGVGASVGFGGFTGVFFGLWVFGVLMCGSVGADCGCV